MESTQNVIFDRAKNRWTKDTILKQQSKQSPQSTITFSDNIDFVAENAISGQPHFVVATGIESITPIHSIHKKLLLNNGANILASEFINFTDKNKKIFTSEANWFKYDEFEDMLNQMEWISQVRINQGKNDVIHMDLSNFKRFLNKTFNMNFNIKKDANENLDNKNENENDEQDEKNNNSKHDKTTNKKSKFNGKNQHNFGNMNNKMSRNN